MQWLSSIGLSVAEIEADGVRVEKLVPRSSTSNTILYLHGGGFVSCSPRTHRALSAVLARCTPATVYAPDYRLAPEHRYPAALDDVASTYRWLISAGVEPRTTALVGDSAGGALVLSLLQQLRDAGDPLPAAAVLLSPWADLGGTAPLVRENDGRCAMFRPENLPAFAACYANPDAWREPSVSPAFGRFHALPPLHIQVDESEVLLADARAIESAVTTAGGSCELVESSGLFHGWQVLGRFLPEARRSLEHAASFMSRSFQSSHTPQPQHDDT